MTFNDIKSNFFEIHTIFIICFFFLHEAQWLFLFVFSTNEKIPYCSKHSKSLVQMCRQCIWRSGAYDLLATVRMKCLSSYHRGFPQEGFPLFLFVSFCGSSYHWRHWFPACNLLNMSTYRLQSRFGSRLNCLPMTRKRLKWWWCWWCTPSNCRLLWFLAKIYWWHMKCTLKAVGFSFTTNYY